MTLRVSLVRGKWHSVWESLACGYLYSFTKDLQEAGAYDKRIEDYRFYDGYFDSDQDIIQGCADADIVGFSGTTSQMAWNARMARAIKGRNPECRIYAGGYGPSVSPEWYVDSFDGIVVGEGERPGRDILETRTETGIVFPPPVEDLDSIPFPDRDFIKVERCIG